MNISKLERLCGDNDLNFHCHNLVEFIREQGGIKQKIRTNISYGSHHIHVTLTVDIKDFDYSIPLSVSLCVKDLSIEDIKYLVFNVIRRLTGVIISIPWYYKDKKSVIYSSVSDTKHTVPKEILDDLWIPDNISGDPTIDS